MKIFYYFLLILVLFINGCNDSESDQSEQSTEGALRISVTGSGMVASEENSIECSVRCSIIFSVNQTVVLSAAPADNYRISSWEGCESYDGTKCTVSVGPDVGNTDIEVVFEKYKSTLDVSVSGSGKVVALDGSMECDSTCTGFYEEGAVIVLSAVEGKNHRLLEWTDCPLVENSNCHITIGPDLQNIQISVSFERYNTVVVQQDGLGIVVASDGSINCGQICEADYSETGFVEYIATAEVDYKFLDWAGCYSSERNSCIVKVGADSEDVTVVARYNPLAIKIYDLDFESPDHEVGRPPAYGFGQKYVTQYYSFGTPFEQFSPTVTQGILSNVITFQPQLNGSGQYPVGEDMSLALGLKADQYRFEWDMQINHMSEFTKYKVFFDWMFSDIEMEFDLDGNVTFNQQFITSIVFGEMFHVVVDLSLLQRKAGVTVNDQEVADIPISGFTTDIGSIRFYLFGVELADSFFVDNIQVTAKLNRELSLMAPNENDEYIIDFEYPTITSNTGQSATSVSPYKQDNFNITYVLRRDASVNSQNIPNNGSVSAGVMLNSRPILFHQYGYAFSLHGIDIADYSNFAGLEESLTIKGYRRDGKILSYLIEPSLISMNFTTFNFSPDWENLDYVLFIGSGYSMDNIVLSVTDEKIQFEPMPLH